MLTLRYIFILITSLLSNAIVLSAQIFSPREVQLQELEVRKTNEKYTKHNNPAVDLQCHIRESAPLYDSDRLPYFSYDTYEKISLAVNRFNPEKNNGNLSFLKEYTDTSQLSGATILNISLKEKISTTYYRNTPHSRKEHVKGVRRIGLDDFIDQSSVQTLLDDVLREVDIFNNDINILQNRFVSPLSVLGPDFYKYYITDTLEVEGEPCTELSFVPRTSQSFGFTGKLYVTTDSTYFVKKVVLGVPRDINLNFVDNLRLIQTFARATDGTRLKNEDTMTVELTVIPGTQGLYARRHSIYRNHGAEPCEDMSVYSIRGRRTEPRSASSRSLYYWYQHRPVPLTASESRLEDMIARLRDNTAYFWAEKFLKIFVTGYIPTSSPDSLSRIDIGPWNTFVSGNDIEGTRLRIGATTTATLSPRWFGKIFMAYGTKDKRLKYGAELEYSFIDKRKHSGEFPIHSVKASHTYDVDMIGQHYLYTNPDNFVLSLTRVKNRLMTYRRTSELKYTLEFENNFSIEAAVKAERQEPGPFLPFITAGGITHDHYDETSFNLTLRYAPGEQFFQTRTQRIPVNQDAPVFTLSHTYAPGGFPGNTFEVNKTEFGVKKRFWFSAFGYLDCCAIGGHVWSRSPYPSLLIPNANLSYTIQPESFALMKPMEFISDSYVSWFLTYWANGAIFNYIPLIKRLRLREVISFRGYLGALSSRNTPGIDNELYRFPDGAYAARMNGRPYMELSAGIDNLLRILRIDYVWRLTYRDTPGIDRGGVRVALHFTF